MTDNTMPSETGDTSCIALPGNRQLGSIFNNDINGLLYVSSGEYTTPDEYAHMVRDMLGYGMSVLAQNVGMPDPVIYRSQVATGWAKYHAEVTQRTWPAMTPAETRHQSSVMYRLLEQGTDPFTLTIAECRKRQVPIIASYRMNGEDWYDNTWMLSDFGRAHPSWRIRRTAEERHGREAVNLHEGNAPSEFTGVLDPAIPEVYAHRMTIFREVAECYDIDGIEFDWRRWCHMISDPLQNHAILTRMVRETRRMLDEVAKAKGRDRLLLGVRVGGSLDTPETVANYPGADSPGADLSCAELGLDVRTWIAEALVDYVCPSLFWPRLPGVPWTREFIELARGKNVGIYPTVFPLPAWAEDASAPVQDSLAARRRHKDEIVRAALQCYEDGADGISTFNWNNDDPDSPLRGTLLRRSASQDYGRACGGYSRVNMQAHRVLAHPDALRALLDADPPSDGLG